MEGFALSASRRKIGNNDKTGSIGTQKEPIGQEKIGFGPIAGPASARSLRDSLGDFEAPPGPLLYLRPLRMPALL
jgi:hypothetical protein